MRTAFCLLLLASVSRLFATGSPIVANPDAFQTLVNPQCSHCVDEAKRRAADLTANDLVLCVDPWLLRRRVHPHSLLPQPIHRVILDSYGVFVYDPDAAYARGFAPGYDFPVPRLAERRHGDERHPRRHRLLVLVRCRSRGAKKGRATKADSHRSRAPGGAWIEWYPNAVAYHMFDKYQPVELPKEENSESVKSRSAKRTRSAYCGPTPS